MKTALFWALGNLIAGAVAFGLFILALLYTEDWAYRVEVLPFFFSGAAVVGVLYWLIVGLCAREPKLSSSVVASLAMGQAGAAFVVMLLLFFVMAFFGG